MGGLVTAISQVWEVMVREGSELSSHLTREEQNQDLKSSSSNAPGHYHLSLEGKGYSNSDFNSER